jgi:hypothetical protein
MSCSVGTSSDESYGVGSESSTSSVEGESYESNVDGSGEYVEGRRRLGELNEVDPSRLD